MPFTFDATLGFTCAGGVYKFMDWCDGTLRSESKKELSNWLTNHPSKIPIHIFARLIDIVFGPRIWSVRFFLRSCAACLLAVSIVLVLYIRLTNFTPEIIAQVVPLIGLYALLSVIPTYASIVFSRSVVLAMAAHPAKLRIVALICLDFFLKAALGTITIFLASLFLNSQDTLAWSDAFGAVKSFYRDGQGHIPFQSSNGTRYGLLFYPVFFTSIWIWLYTLSGVLTMLIARLDATSRVLLSRLDIESHPLRSAGIVLAPVIFCLAVVLSPLVASKMSP
jgi:hypothetical protein